MMQYDPLPPEMDSLAGQIVDSAYHVHRLMGPGLLERVYEICFCYELYRRNIKYLRQVVTPVSYMDIEFNEGLRMDVLVENCIVCEIKSVDQINPVWEAQVLSYMKLTKNRLGFLINFNVVNIGHGIKRFVL